MFLDDKLYQHTINREIKDRDTYTQLVNELYKICEDHFKPQLRPNMSYKEGKIMIDRVFNSWDLFINKLDKKDWYLIDFLKDASYKVSFMKNPELKRIYDLGT